MPVEDVSKGSTHEGFAPLHAQIMMLICRVGCADINYRTNNDVDKGRVCFSLEWSVRALVHAQIMMSTRGVSHT